MNDTDQNNTEKKSKSRSWIPIVLLIVFIIALPCLLTSSAINTNNPVSGSEEMSLTYDPDKNYEALTDQEYYIQVGNGVTYYFAADRTLLVSGNGAVPDFETLEAAQKYLCSALYVEYGKKHKANANENDFMSVLLNVKQIEIEEGITEIGQGAFSTFYYVESVTVPASVKKVNKTAFVGTGQYAEETEWIGLELFGMDFSDISVVLLNTESEATNSAYVTKDSVPVKSWDVPQLDLADLIEVIKFGEHIEYQLYTDGTLLVYGIGETYGFDYYAEVYEYLMGALHCTNREEVNTRWFNNIKTIVIEEGVTGVGAYALAGYRNAREVYVCTALETTGQKAFLNLGANEKEDITWNADFSGTECADNTFENCKNKPEGFK